HLFMGLFPPMLEVIPTRFRQRQARVYLYNVTRSLLLSGRAETNISSNFWVYVVSKIRPRFMTSCLMLWEEPARKMIPTFLPTIIRETCGEFVSSYNELRMEILPEKLEHDRSWKEEEEILAEVTKRILG
ncbi:18219_t:CDS:2, partial [Funneliformis geosporum]